MTEILTESFCERCGTRYTFEAATPRRRRMSGLKVLGKGLKNFVLSDDSSLDEALAAARSDVELEATTHQLDAFHKTFNFCMTCRQYTCANCWDPVEGRCLSCSTGQMPVLTTPVDAVPLDRGMLIGEEIPPERLAFDAWPSADGTPTANDSVGLQSATDDAPATAERPSEPGGMVPAATDADLASESPIAPDDEPLPDEAVVPEALSTDAAPDGEAAGEAGEAGVAGVVAGADEHAWVEADAVVTAEAPTGSAVPLDASADMREGPAAEAAAVEPEPVAVETQAAAVEPEPIAVEPEPVAGPAEATAGGAVPPQADEAPRARRPRARFRPGQSLDEEIAAYEARLAAEGTAAEPVDAEATVPDVALAAAEPDSALPAVAPLAEREPEPVGVGELEAVDAAEPGAPPAAEPIAAAAEPAAEPLTPEPEPVPVAAEPVPEPEPVAAAEPAPDTLPTATPSPIEPSPARPRPAPELRPAAPTAPAAPPAWPTAPRWPAPVQPAATADRAPIGDPLAAALARRATDAMWAASAQDVVRLPMPSHAAPTPAVQSCQSCGLSLSATARFCRRCGARQDG